MNNLIQKIKMVYNSLCVYNTNQWKHWTIGVLFAMFLLFVKVIWSVQSMTSIAIVIYTAVLMILFELYQMISYNMSLPKSIRPRTYQIIDSVYDILVGISGAIFIIYFLKILHIIK